MTRTYQQIIDEATEYLREEIPEESKILIRRNMESDPITWWAPFHFIWGMGIRNLLREHVATDDELSTGNWDDHYIQCVEAAVQVQRGE